MALRLGNLLLASTENHYSNRQKVMRWEPSNVAVD